MTWGTKNIPPKKNLSRGCLSNWCDADTDADAEEDTDEDATEHKNNVDPCLRSQN